MIKFLLLHIHPHFVYFSSLGRRSPYGPYAAKVAKITVYGL